MNRFDIEECNDNELLKQLALEMRRQLSVIGETCVDESKLHITPEKAIKSIRNTLYEGQFKLDKTVQKIREVNETDLKCTNWVDNMDMNLETKNEILKRQVNYFQNESWKHNIPVVKIKETKEKVIDLLAKNYASDLVPMISNEFDELIFKWQNKRKSNNQNE